MRFQFRVYVLATLVSLCAAPAFAHDEALFGPQSAAVLSAVRFASAQVFTRETGPEGDRRRQTTTVFSAGMQPFKRPLSVAVVVPVSFIGRTSTAAGRTGIEQIAPKYDRLAILQRLRNSGGRVGRDQGTVLVGAVPSMAACLSRATAAIGGR